MNPYLRYGEKRMNECICQFSIECSGEFWGHSVLAWKVTRNENDLLVKLHLKPQFSERLRNLPKSTQLANGRVRAQTNAV
jgi:hypothetical protein